MKFVFYTSLNKKAKEAFDKGDGRHGDFIIDSGHIAAADEHGRAQDFIKVIHNNSQPIEAQE